MNLPNLNVQDQPVSAPSVVPPVQPEGLAMGAQQTPELPQEQMKTNLQDMMAKIENKYQDFNSQKFASDNKLMEQQGGTLRQVFDLFESMGVDPSNVEEVRALLDKIKETNPELSQQLEIALGSVLGEEPPVEGEVPVEGEIVEEVPGQIMPEGSNMNMNNNETSQKNI